MEKRFSQVIHIADNRLDFIIPVAGRSALAAVITGFAFGITSMIMNLTWQDYYDNIQLMQIMNVQWLANILLIVILTAAISITLSGMWIKSTKTAIIPGFISGFVLVFTAPFFSVAATLIQMSPLFVTKIPDSYTMFDYFAENPVKFFGGFFAAGDYILIAYSLIAAVITGIVGLAYWSLVFRHGESHKNVSAKSITTILAAVLIVLIIPPAIGFTGLHMGWIEKSWNEYYGDYAGTVTVSRANENTIYVNYTGSSDLELDSQMPIMININGKNATNTEAIRQSGLNASISPTEGLKNVKGAFVEYTGSDVLPAIHQEAYNYTYNGTHVIISYVRYDGERDVVYDCVV